MGMAFVPNAKAHEFWIAPSKWVIEKGQELGVALKIGSDFSGFQQVYMPHKFTRFDLINAEDSMPIKGRIGDRPAGALPCLKTGYISSVMKPRQIQSNINRLLTSLPLQMKRGNA